MLKKICKKLFNNSSLNFEKASNLQLIKKPNYDTKNFCRKNI